MDELKHKMILFFRYRRKFGEEEIVKRLGLKQWEHEYFLKCNYGRLHTERPTEERSED